MQEDDDMQEIGAELQANPDIQRVYHAGYTIRYSFRTDRQALYLSVFHRGRPAAATSFAIRQADGFLQAETTHVYPSHERKGIGNAMYVCAEKLADSVIIPAAGQSVEARAFWAQHNRPWGNRHA